MKNLSRKTGKKITTLGLCLGLVGLCATMSCEKLRNLRVDELVEAIETIKDSCIFNDPLTDLPWLENLINVWKQNRWHSMVYQCTYKDGIGFLLIPCVECPGAGYSFRDCEGVVLCGGGGESSEDSCAKFYIDFANKKLICEVKP